MDSRGIYICLDFDKDEETKSSFRLFLGNKNLLKIF